MFSNSIKYALEETVREFNDFLHNKVNTCKYSATDYKNAFYQRLRKNFQRTNDWHTVAYSFGFDNLVLGIENGYTTHLEFIVTNRYSTKQEEFIKELNIALKEIDLVKIADENLAYCGVMEQFNNVISQINNFKVRR